MRLVSVTVLGTALIAAGMLAPAAGEATATRQDGITVDPGTVRPGEQVRIWVPGCAGMTPAATSEVFTGRAVKGTATVKQDAVPATYRVIAQCGTRKVIGEVRVAGRVVWPEILPTGHDAR